MFTHKTFAEKMINRATLDKLVLKSIFPLNLVMCIAVMPSVLSVVQDLVVFEEFSSHQLA